MASTKIRFLFLFGLVFRREKKKLNLRSQIGKIEKIEENILDSIPSPSVKIQIIGRKVYLR